jgi:hypothetical protein
MIDLQSLGDWSAQKFPRKPMRSDLSPAYAHFAVSLGIATFLPFPAFIV